MPQGLLRSGKSIRIETIPGTGTATPYSVSPRRESAARPERLAVSPPPPAGLPSWPCPTVPRLPSLAVPRQASSLLRYAKSTNTTRAAPLSHGRLLHAARRPGGRHLRVSARVLSCHSQTHIQCFKHVPKDDINCKDFFINLLLTYKTDRHPGYPGAGRTRQSDDGTCQGSCPAPPRAEGAIRTVHHPHGQDRSDDPCVVRRPRNGGRCLRGPSCGESRRRRHESHGDPPRCHHHEEGRMGVPAGGRDIWRARASPC